MKNLDRKDITCAIFLDLAKAFDSVNHKILLQKLEKYGVRGIPLKFLESYLSNRWQYIKLTEKYSDLESLKTDFIKGDQLIRKLLTEYNHSIQEVNPRCNSIYLA